MSALDETKQMMGAIKRAKERAAEEFEIAIDTRPFPESVMMLKGLLSTIKDLNDDELHVVTAFAESLKYGKLTDSKLSRDKVIHDFRSRLDSLNLLCDE